VPTLPGARVVRVRGHAVLQRCVALRASQTLPEVVVENEGRAVLREKEGTNGGGVW
jgi:hypothetical protein